MLRVPVGLAVRMHCIGYLPEFVAADGMVAHSRRTMARVHTRTYARSHECTRTRSKKIDPVTGSTLFLVVVLLLFSGRQPAVHAPLQIARQPIEELVKDLLEVETFLATSKVCVDRFSWGARRRRAF